ncbi:hypothetical protein ACFQYP_15780 [Nonomuraea antimicrobica]
MAVERLGHPAQAPLPVPCRAPLVGQPGGGHLGLGGVDRLLDRPVTRERLGAGGTGPDRVLQVLAQHAHAPRVHGHVVDHDVDPAYLVARGEQHERGRPLLAHAEAGQPPRAAAVRSGRVRVGELHDRVEPGVDGADVLAAALAGAAPDERAQALVPAYDVTHGGEHVAPGHAVDGHALADVVLERGGRVGRDPLDPLLLRPGQPPAAQHRHGRCPRRML